MHMLVDVIDPVERDVMVLAISGIVLGQLDAGCAIHVVNGADMGAVLGKNFHVFADLICRNHWSCSSWVRVPEKGATNGFCSGAIRRKGPSAGWGTYIPAMH
jgi:hypothetical protein